MNPSLWAESLPAAALQSTRGPVDDSSPAQDNICTIRNCLKIKMDTLYKSYSSLVEGYLLTDDYNDVVNDF